MAASGENDRGEEDMGNGAPFIGAREQARVLGA